MHEHGFAKRSNGHDPPAIVKLSGWASSSAAASGLGCYKIFDRMSDSVPVRKEGDSLLLHLGGLMYRCASPVEVFHTSCFFLRMNSN